MTNIRYVFYWLCQESFKCGSGSTQYKFTFTFYVKKALKIRLKYKILQADKTFGLFWEITIYCSIVQIWGGLVGALVTIKMVKINFDTYVFMEVFMTPMVKVGKINIQRSMGYIFLRLLYDFIDWPWQYILHLIFLVFNRWSSWSCLQECRTKHWGLTCSALTSTGSWSPSCTGCWSVPDRNLLKVIIMLLKVTTWLKYATNKMDDKDNIRG